MIIKIRKSVPSLSKDAYLSRFGIEKKDYKYQVVNKEFLTRSYEKAWENRNYEIDKFWTRAAYFWGFIVIIFTGYITILTSEQNQKALEMRIDLYLVLLGFLFSLSWWLIILGSKRWQENWEHHIDMLEDFVSGPLYKTIYYSGHRFYSVSKVNEIISIAVFIVWSGLLAQHIYSNYTWAKGLEQIDIVATVSIILTFVFACSLSFGYSLGKYKMKKKGFLDRKEYNKLK